MVCRPHSGRVGMLLRWAGLLETDLEAHCGGDYKQILQASWPVRSFTGIGKGALKEAGTSRGQLTMIAVTALASVLAVASCGTEPEPEPDPASTGSSTATATPMVTTAATPTPSACDNCEELLVESDIEQACADDLDGLCSPRDASEFALFFSPGAQGGAAASPSGGRAAAPSVEEVLEKGLYLLEASPVHIVFEGRTLPGTVRCHWRGTARTLSQREKSIRFWLSKDDDEPLPSPIALEAEFMSHVEGVAPRYRPYVAAQFLPLARGGFSDELLRMTCYADYTVSRFTLGSGPGSVTVVYNIYSGGSRSYDLYKRSHAAGEFSSGTLTTESEYEQMLARQVSKVQGTLADILEGRASVVFLAPMGAHLDVAIEAWEAVQQWDLQVDEVGQVNAVRYGVDMDDPEYSQDPRRAEGTYKGRRRIRQVHR